VASIAVLSSPYVLGADDLSNTANLDRARVYPAEECLRWDFQHDAMMVCYEMATGEAFPRLNKSCLPWIRHSGSEVVLSWICVDIDNPSHAAWSDGQVAGFVEYAEAMQAREDLPASRLLRDYYAFWTTRAGCRFLYRLTTPVFPEEHETLSAGIADGLASLGIQADRQCGQWNHYFRLPSVLRDGHYTKHAASFLLDVQPEKSIDPREIPKGAPHSTATVGNPLRISRVSLQRPDIDDSRRLCEVPDSETGRIRLTVWGVEAKRRLMGRDYFPAIFEYTPLAAIGSRDVTLYSAVASAVSLLYGLPTTTPQHIYGLFLPTVQGLAPDSGTPDWLSSLWDKIRSTWAIEEAKNQAGQILEATRRDEMKSDIQSIHAGMSLWFPHPAMREPLAAHGVGSEAIEIIGKHLVVMLPSGREFYVMQKNGRYFSIGLGAAALLPAIRQHLGDGILPTTTPTKGAEVRDRTSTEIINSHGTIISEVVYEPGEQQGGYLRNANTDRAKLVIVPFSRNSELVPAPSAAVDEWLGKMFSPADKYNVERWIAWALAFEEGPIAALSIVGYPGCGKGMLVEGLKECLHTPQASSFEELLGQWQYSLVQTPFVVANEGMGSNKFSGMHPADVLRRMIGSSSDIKASRKNLGPSTITLDARFVLTANNLSLVRAMTADRDLTSEDREALLIRILHVNALREASDWLRDSGGRAYTNGWVSDGRKSDYLLARHFLWLYSNRRNYARSPRLLVEGSITSQVMAELRLHGGTQDRVLEAIIAVGQHAAKRPNADLGVRIFRGCVLAVTSGIHKYIREDMNILSARVSDVRVVVRAMQADPDWVQKRLGYDPDKTDGTLRLEGDRRDWHAIDIELLTSAADRYGWNIAPLLSALEESTINPTGSYEPRAPIPFRLPTELAAPLRNPMSRLHKNTQKTQPLVDGTR